MVWVIYFPVVLIIVVAIAAGIAVLVRKVRGKDYNPYVENGSGEKKR
ncbi:MAG: hypothetical protein JSU73_11705 [candidate division WOR-3 bacterium]|nr:MAG: hypothetical protein JSU73_11705 [candidate division WOR-3 bacterium]